jgi:putative oxidoreductase
MKAITLRYKTVVVSIVLGALFVYAGAMKIRDPLAVADTIAAFGIIPLALINSFALAIPSFEIISGALLIAGWYRRMAALGLLIALGAYTVAIASALARGITIDCGCFGVGPGTRGAMWWDFGRDLAMLAAAFAVYAWSMPSPAAVQDESRAA